MPARQAEALALFSRLDLNGDGELSHEELAAELSDFGMAELQIEQLFSTLDLNGDGACRPYTASSLLHR